MQCPECKGLGKIHIPAQEGIQKSYLMDCPTCGEPIRAEEKWCEAHRAAQGVIDDGQ